MLSIEQITPQLTWQLRRDVLYPGKYKHDMEMEEDNEGYHFGAFTDNKLVAVISLFKHSDHHWQFRKFAVSEVLQGTGIGTQLLNYITNFVLNEGGQLLYCHARLSAIGFYEKHGYKQVGDVFNKGGIDFIRMEICL
ncbi:GNAT family N-acetyltransferase [Mucilaginibacter pallidiroseus]|uniref:GNAT family N-acetyltransferase n=1 Tax=Mucilaginibacter pallidiroseus TaxID=2599295 RepID=A0A563UDK0_9SPHI|nr:GNAT family N-acetyltransferase [Mucilaginibacter pallidiroseus]TWR29363.1 GNAT family N-acetyltransferase [Mucilaginibacter pallidiroseus]